MFASKGYYFNELDIQYMISVNKGSDMESESEEILKCIEELGLTL